MQNKLFINFILLSRIFFFLNIPEYSFSWIFQNILFLEYSRIFLFQNILLPEYSTSRIFHFQNIPLLEHSSSRIFYFQNTLFLEHSSNRMFYQRTINASRSHVDSTLLSTDEVLITDWLFQNYLNYCCYLKIFSKDWEKNPYLYNLLNRKIKLFINFIVLSLNIQFP